MKIMIFGLFMLHATSVFAQFREGFDLEEVKDLIAMCNSYTFLDLYGNDEQILPTSYQKVYTSETIGMDNKFQVYSNEKVAVLNFRGSTNQISSWIENMYSAMIPAKGKMTINKKKKAYIFAKNKKAGVHAGYALAVVLLSDDVIRQIKKLNEQGIYAIIITGHSQGGALTNLMRAYLENLPKGTISSKNVFKNYAFANPMCGNKEFANEYNERYTENNTSYSIINPSDLVPMMPMHYQEEKKLLSKERLKNWLLGKESVDLKQLGINLIVRKFEKELKNYVQVSNKFIEKSISKTLTAIEMPPYMDDINYFQVGNIRELQPFVYPKIKLDPNKMSEKELSKIAPDEDGNYYQKEPSFYQHKPYNYYVGFLAENFDKEHNKLELKYLPENL